MRASANNLLVDHGCGGRAGQVVDAGLGGVVAAEVTVAAQAGPPGRRQARPADVHRKRGGAVRLGEATQVMEGEVLAGEADPLLAAGPQQAKHIDRLVGAAAARGELDPDRLRLAGQHSQPHGQQPHPPRGQHVDRGELLGQHNRMAVGQQQHAGAQRDPFGLGRDEAQAFQRVGDRQVSGELDRAGLCARIQDDVLGHVKGLEAAVFRVLGDRRQVAGVRAGHGSTVHDPELHRASSRPLR
jgi:hypothetical protein